MQQPGTVTAIRCTWVDAPALTVCLRDEDTWVSGQGRAATREEIKSFAAKALGWFLEALVSGPPAARN